MKSYTQAFADFLNDNNEFVVCDLYEFGMVYPYWDSLNGVRTDVVYARYTTFDKPMIVNGDTYSASGALIDRSRVRQTVGIEVDKLNLTINATNSMSLNGKPFMQAVTAGILDGATVKLDRCYMDSSLVVQGTVNMFSGRVSTVKTSRSVIEMEVSSDLELLNINMPRNLYQAGCMNTLYDANCGANQATIASTLTVGANSTASTIYCTSSKASGWFDLGGLIFDSGSNANALRTIKSWDGTKLELVSPLPYAPIAGQTFHAYPGCDKKSATCTAKFNNVVHFRGFPFIPQPETMR